MPNALMFNAMIAVVQVFPEEETACKSFLGPNLNDDTVHYHLSLSYLMMSENALMTLLKI